MCPIFYNCQVLNCQSLLKYNTLNPMLWLSCKHFSLLSLQFHSFHLFIHSVNSIQSFNHSLTQFIYSSYIISYLYEACSSFSCYLCSCQSHTIFVFFVFRYNCSKNIHVLVSQPGRESLLFHKTENCNRGYNIMCM